jgi:serine/threonine-protein kinase
MSEALELRRRVLGPRHPSTLETLNNLATIRFRRGRYAWAAEVQQEVVAARRAERPGLDDDDTITMVSNLGVMRLRSGDLAAAERHLVEALDARRRLFDDGHPSIGTSVRLLAEMRRVQGRHAQAVALGEEALAILAQHLPDDHVRLAEARITIGAALIDGGRSREAIPLLRSAVAAREAKLPAGTAEIAEARVWLGAAVARAGARAEARTLLAAAIAAYEALGRPDEAPAIRGREELAALR